jgi:hypothetical protein
VGCASQQCRQHPLQSGSHTHSHTHDGMREVQEVGSHPMLRSGAGGGGGEACTTTQPWTSGGNGYLTATAWRRAVGRRAGVGAAQSSPHSTGPRWVRRQAQCRRTPDQQRPQCRQHRPRRHCWTVRTRRGRRRKTQPLRPTHPQCPHHPWGSGGWYHGCGTHWSQSLIDGWLGGVSRGAGVARGLQSTDLHPAVRLVRPRFTATRKHSTHVAQGNSKHTHKHNKHKHKQSTHVGPERITQAMGAEKGKGQDPQRKRRECCVLDASVYQP